MLPYALSVFLGAFLLFQVQPLIGKYILPWFGGSPGTWTTCLLFFQTALLGGYAYAHLVSSRLNRRQQAWTHLLLLAVALACLPIIPSDAWKPVGGQEPIGRILLLLAATVGVPYFALSATGPLLQQWFSQTHPGRSPYRLYALSNVGSLLALLSYPFVFEWALSRQIQAWAWSGGLVVFAGICGYCAWQQSRGSARSSVNAAPAGPGLTGAPAADPVAERSPTGMAKTLWLVLPAIASVLLIATTNQLSQDIAVIPFLWVLPLALYLLSFILCFDHPRWYRRGPYTALLVIGSGTVCYLLFTEAGSDFRLQLAGYLGALFVACMICHGELYRARPSPRHLTSFYLSIAAGGAIGGFLVGVVAPLCFDRYAELQMGLWALAYTVGMICLLDRSQPIAYGALIGTGLLGLILPALDLSPSLDVVQLLADYYDAGLEFYGQHWKEAALVLVVAVVAFGARPRTTWRQWAPRLGGYVMALSVGLGIALVVQVQRTGARVIYGTRNFYGTLRVTEEMSDQPKGHHYKLVHGVITHGLQFRDPEQAAWPTTYYGETSGVGLAIEHLTKPRGQRRLGLVGLGTGSLATYGAAGDRLRIYEINPAVEKIARTYFTNLEIGAAQVDVVLGDARLSMEHELAQHQRQGFDLLALDAFSSDAIPVHLLTQEALAVYLQHLEPKGILAVHISNRYLDLQPIVDKLAQRLGLTAITLSDDESENWWIYKTKWMLLCRDPAVLDLEVYKPAFRPTSPQRDQAPLWTDDHASIVPILR